MCVSCRSLLSPQERHLPPKNVLRRAVHTLMYNSVMDGLIMGVILCNTIIMLFVSAHTPGRPARLCTTALCCAMGLSVGIILCHTTIILRCALSARPG